MWQKGTFMCRRTGAPQTYEQMAKNVHSGRAFFTREHM